MCLSVWFLFSLSLHFIFLVLRKGSYFSSNCYFYSSICKWHLVLSFFVIGFLLWGILKLAAVVLHSIWYALISFYSWVSQVALVVKNLLANTGDVREVGLILGLGRSCGGGHGNTLQYSCLDNPREQRNLEGCSPQGHTELDVTEAT